MRHDLAGYIPEIAGNQLLMCCACGRYLSQEWFDLEHLIPQQALKQDPAVVQNDPMTPKNVRAGTLLLCRKPLMVKGTIVYRNGCNSWKGRFYDRPIRELVSGSALQSNACTQVHIIAALSLGYLAMVAEFGYVVALMQSGLLMRQQFFMPYKYHRALPLRHQMLLGHDTSITSPDARMWSNPFSFGFDVPGCTVAMRNFVVIVPVSRDPRVRLAKHLRIVPSKYALRPNFKTVFH
jgi:hypothetical protein